MEIHDFYARVAAFKDPVHTMERIFQRLHESRSHQVDDRDGIRPSVEHAHALSYHVVAVVRRTYYRAGTLPLGFHGFLAEAVVSGGYDVRAGFEYRVGGGRINAVAFR